MQSTELLERFREDVVDQEKPYLWSDSEVLSYIDSAQSWLCRKTDGISDASSPLTVLTVGIGTEWVALDSRVLHVRAAHLSNGTELAIINYEDMRSKGIKFDGHLGRPKYLIVGMEPGNIRLHPKSGEAFTINLIVDRMPLKRVTDLDQKLEVHDRHFEGLGLWIRHRAYSKQDAETLNSAEAESLKAQFDEYCEISRRERERAKHKTRVVQYGGI